MSYSQFGEDKYISSLFPNDYIGTCVEVGAYDGITLSNTLYFEKKGWSCLCIEPIPLQYGKCKSIRKNAINCAISDSNKEDIPFYIYNINNNNESAMSSLEPDSRLIESHKDIINNVLEIKVKCRTLTSILDEAKFPNVIDFISIDTENTELDVLKGFDFSKYSVRYFIIENNFNEPFCEDYLKKFGYVKKDRLGVNDIFEKSNKVNQIETWTFYEGLDSSGGDISRCNKRDIVSLKAAAESDPSCVAFNTLGFLKSSVRFPLQKTPYLYCGPDGLYVKKSYTSTTPYLNFHGELQCGKYVDQTLREYFPDYSYKGVFLDIGAYEPINISNSYHFERNGYTVICFEANTNLISDLKAQRNNVYNYAISYEDKDMIEFNVVNGSWGGGSLTAGVSAIDLDPNYLKAFSSGIKSIEKISVAQKSLNSCLPEILKGHVNIDIVSIDVEGGELNCIKGFDLNRYKVKVFVIENIFKNLEISEYLINHGYILDKIIEYNEYYIKLDAF
jgi:FkbM family methyltransferase